MKVHVDKSMGIVTLIPETLVKIKPAESTMRMEENQTVPGHFFILIF